MFACVFASVLASGQAVEAGTGNQGSGSTATVQERASGKLTRAMRARRFLAGRVLAGGGSAAEAMAAARQEHAAMVAARSEAGADVSTGVGARAIGAKAVTPRLNPLSAVWTAVGPGQIASQSYGYVTGRVTSVAIDPTDASGNTVYLGTTGGGVWKSTNAAGPAASVVFLPLTDTLPVYSANSSAQATASLSIGTVSVGAAAGGSVVLAGTGDPNDALDSYYGEGILRSADGGLTWTLAQYSNDPNYEQHSFTGLGVAGIAWSSTTPGLVVAAMSQAAEGVLVNAVDLTNSVMGLYYSTDAGVTWQMGTIEDGSSVVQRPQPVGFNNGGNAATAVVWNAVRQRFYAAVRYHGYYESVDGMTWTRLAHQPGTGLSTTACPTNPNGIGNATCPIFRGALAVQAATGDTFALTVDGSNLDQGLWQDVCGLSGGACGTSPIAFGKQLASGPLEVGAAQTGGSTAIAQGDYDLSLSAVATGSGASADTLLYVGTVDLYRCSLAAGCVLRNTTNALNGCAAPAMVAPAQHAIATLAGVGTGGLPLLVVGNDGGAWRSTDGVNQQQTPCSADDATHFQNLNAGLGSLAEVVSFAQHPTDPATMLAGLGSAGTAATAAATSGAAWPQMSAGEGGAVAIDQTNPQNWYVSTEAGVSARYCAKGNGCAAADFLGVPTIGYAQVNQDASVLDPPFLLDPALASDALIGTCRVWRGPAESGASWPGSNAISTQLGSRVSGGFCTASNAFVRSLGAGGPASGSGVAQDAGSTVLYAGMAGSLDGGAGFAGHVFANYAAGTAGASTLWTDVGTSTVTNQITEGGVFNQGGFDVSSLVVDTHDATGKTVYATVMGFGGNGLSPGHVYQSTNGGASWLNISKNLPNAPANGLVVDPNDANTIYVAMDTGVYVTTTVSTCTTASCWSVFGAGLPNAPVVGIAVAPGMATGDGRTGELRVATYGRGIWELPLVTAAYPAAPGMALSPATLTFATQAEGTASAAQTVIVTNFGNAPLTVTQVTAAGDFTETNTCVGTPLAGGATCAVQVVFVPSVTGTRPGVLTVYGNASSGQQAVSLTGLGAAPGSVVLSPLSVTYLTTNVGTTSAAQTITLTNPGGFSATLGTPGATGDFSVASSTCGATLAAGATCAVSVVFAPTAGGIRTGSFSIADSAGTQTASLTGVGVAPAAISVSASMLTYSATTVGAVSVAQMLTLSNTGGLAATLATPVVSGDFNLSANTCGATLAVNATCTVSITFAPMAVGPRTGNFAVTGSAGTQMVALSGNGLSPAVIVLSPTALAYAGTTVRTQSAPQTITVSNTGGSTAVLGLRVTEGDFIIITNTCGASLAANATCTFTIVFAPLDNGAFTGTFNLTDNVGTQIALLSGAGVVPATMSLSSTLVTYSATNLGSSSAAQVITVSNTGGLVATLGTPFVTGDFSINSSTCGATLAGNATCAISIVFTPTVSGTRTGSFSLTDSVGTQAATLTGVGVAPAAISISPSSVTYSQTNVGQVSAAQVITITDTGGLAATLGIPIVAGDFRVTSSTCGATLAAGSACAVSVAFAPTAVGTRTGSLSETDSVGTHTAALTGVAVMQAAIAVSATAITYSGTVVGAASGAQTITISNTGGLAATLGTPALTGDFSITLNTCGATLAGGGDCIVAIAFTPTASGTRAGSFSLIDSVGTVAVTLSGAALSPAAIVLSPLAVTYSGTTVGTVSAAQAMSVTNTGGATATLGMPVVTGDFSITSSTCGATLAAGVACAVSVAFAPAATGARTGSFSLTNSAATQTAALTGVGVPPALIVLSASALTYAGTSIGVVSAAQTITISNTGGLTATLGIPMVVGDFTLTANACGATLAAGATCPVSVVFAPTVTGGRTGSFNLTDSSGTQTVALSGLGLAPPAIVLNPASMVYTSTNVGSVSAAQNLTIANTGGLTATLGTPVVTGEFKVTANTCGAALAPNVTCTVAVVFAPTASGTRTGSLSVTGSSGTETAPLTGLGVLAATDGLSPLALTFAPQQLNTASATQAVTLTNTGDTSLVLIGAAIASGDFTVVNACGNALIGHASCSILVAFVPKSVGAGTGLLTVSDQYRNQTVVLNGSALAPAGVSLSPTVGLTFAVTGVGSTAAAQTATLTNNGGLPLAIQSVVVTGDFAIVPGSNTCGASLAAGAACTAQVVFMPTFGGARTGSLTVVDSAAGSPQSLALAGTGLDFTLAADGPTSATIAAGSFATYALLLRSDVGTPGTVTFTCGPLPAHATCVVSPATPALGATTVISVTVDTSVAGAALRIPGERQMVWLAGLLPFGMLALRRRKIGAFALLCGLMVVTGCGASRIIPLASGATGVGGGTPTPSGTYNLVVAGTSAGLTRSVGLTLVVQ